MEAGRTAKFAYGTKPRNAQNSALMMWTPPTAPMCPSGGVANHLREASMGGQCQSTQKNAKSYTTGGDGWTIRTSGPHGHHKGTLKRCYRCQTALNVAPFLAGLSVA